MHRTQELQLASILAGALLATQACLAQDAPAVAPVAPVPEQPAMPAKDLPEFPPVVEKKLWAKVDLRGKKLEDFHVEKWLTDEPSREGKVILIDFWATWCGPCRALIPELNEIKTEFADDLVVIGISDEAQAKVEAFLAKSKAEYPMAIDTEKKMKSAIGVQGIPHVLVVDSTGVVRWQGFPQSDEDRLTSDVIRQIIKADKARRPTATSDLAAPATPPAEVEPPANPQG